MLKASYEDGWVLCQKCQQGMPYPTDGIGAETDLSVPVEIAEKRQKSEESTQAAGGKRVEAKEMERRSNSDGKMADIMGFLISNEKTHRLYKLVDIMG